MEKIMTPARFIAISISFAASITLSACGAAQKRAEDTTLTPLSNRTFSYVAKNIAHGGLSINMNVWSAEEVKGWLKDDLERAGMCPHGHKILTENVTTDSVTLGTSGDFHTYRWTGECI